MKVSFMKEMDLDVLFRLQGFRQREGKWSNADR